MINREDFPDVYFDTIKLKIEHMAGFYNEDLNCWHFIVFTLPANKTAIKIVNRMKQHINVSFHNFDKSYKVTNDIDLIGEKVLSDNLLQELASEAQKLNLGY